MPALHNRVYSWVSQGGSLPPFRFVSLYIRRQRNAMLLRRKRKSQSWARDPPYEITASRLSSLAYQRYQSAGTLLELIVLVLGHRIAQVDEKLRKTSLRCCVISKNRGESSISEWFWQALTQCLPGSIVVAQPRNKESITRQQTRET